MIPQSRERYKCLGIEPGRSFTKVRPTFGGDLIETKTAWRCALGARCNIWIAKVTKGREKHPRRGTGSRVPRGTNVGTDASSMQDAKCMASKVRELEEIEDEQETA